MAKFCSKCGNAVNDTDNVCSNCGNQLNTAQINQIVIAKPKIPGRGFGISSMILGILGLVYGLAMLGNILIALEDFSKYYLESLISPTVIWTIVALLAIIFSVCALGRKYRNGISASGLILGILGFAMCITDIVIICVNL